MLDKITNDLRDIRTRLADVLKTISDFDPTNNNKLNDRIHSNVVDSLKSTLEALYCIRISEIKNELILKELDD